jgi:hypothetical protein
MPSGREVLQSGAREPQAKPMEADAGVPFSLSFRKDGIRKLRKVGVDLRRRSMMELKETSARWKEEADAVRRARKSLSLKVETLLENCAESGLATRGEREGVSRKPSNKEATFSMLGVCFLM